MKTKPIPNLTAEQIDRFWSKVDRRGIDECWEWMGATNGEKNYGQLTIAQRHLYAHWVAFTLYYCDPGALQICHTCDNPLCCNPEHHAIGTNADNVGDMVKKGRARGGAIHPLNGTRHHGHKLTESDVRQIRLLNGYNHAQLSRLFGVSQSVISEVRNRKAWKHVA